MVSNVIFLYIWGHFLKIWKISKSRIHARQSKRPKRYKYLEHELDQTACTHTLSSRSHADRHWWKLAFSSLLCVKSFLLGLLTSCLLQPDTSWLSQMPLTPPCCRPDQTQPLPNHFSYRKEETNSKFWVLRLLAKSLTEQICTIKWLILIFY